MPSQMGRVVQADGKSETLIGLPQPINPYESPRVTTTSTLVPHPELVGTLARRGWAYRRIEIRGRFDAVVEDDGRGMGYETVLLNGQPIARVTSTGHLSLADRL